MAVTPVDPRPLDILDGDLYVNDPYSRYAWLRENSPCHWDAINELRVLTRYVEMPNAVGHVQHDVVQPPNGHG